MESTDYFTIVLNGYINHNKYLKEYFLRECRKANAEHVEYKEFFDRCEDVIDYFFRIMDTYLQDRKKELRQILNISNDQETIEYCEAELNEISRNNFPINLFQISKGRFIGTLSEDEVNFIKLRLLKARLFLSEEAITNEIEKITNRVSNVEIKLSKKKEQKKQPIELIDLFVEAKKSKYNSLLSRLKNINNPVTRLPWIDENNNWTHLERGAQQYMAALIAGLKEKDLISKGATKAVYASCFNKTFRANLSEETLKKYAEPAIKYQNAVKALLRDL